MKIAQYGTAIVVMHALTNGLHGLAHVEIPVRLSLVQSLFVGIVIFPTPIIAAVLLWTQFYRIGSWLLLSSIAGSLLFGIYNHFIVISPDHVSQVSFEGWGLLFARHSLPYINCGWIGMLDERIGIENDWSTTAGLMNSLDLSDFSSYGIKHEPHTQE
ncbi:hypothetical protein SAMD00079811_70040 [Scytonema sp. HK-05]|uniref:hypothetical protein n=1 Tax=Scytonema sp. HK-05 TaxID=1137095 RepID=UPI000B610E41|nr:hypothetical protein [Scytonema sp. HK-05]BAY49375.1 hypothetical protein SAMD00079811_70040 [Scytonema sp. HK-05]